MYRIILALAAVTVLGAGLYGIDASMAAQGNGPSPAPPALPTTPPPPARIGCYRLINDVWAPKACATRAFIRAHYAHPELEDGIASAPVKPPPSAPSFTFGSLYMKFVQVGTEKDLKLGQANAYSIQNNATFTGKNGVADGVQFAEQIRPGGPVGVCIWQVDIKTQNYGTTCTTAPGDVPLAAGDVTDIEGYVRAGGKLAMVAYVPWSATQYAVVAPDKYGLTGRWQNISGSVLGWANSSHAQFSSAEVETIVDVSSCSGDTGSVTCPQAPVLKGHAYSSYSGATGETNNLVPVIGSAPAFLPALQQLAVDEADIEYVSTTTGACPSGTAPPLCGLSQGNG